jgi:hypothetical protein
MKRPEKKPRYSRHSLREIYDAAMIIKRREPRLEAILATDPYYAYLYAARVCHDRFIEGEPAILTDRMWTNCYIGEVLMDRWPEAEDFISKDPMLSKRYRARFPKVELEWLMNGWLDWLDT